MSKATPPLDPATLRWVAKLLEANGEQHWKAAIYARMPGREDEEQGEWNEGVFRLLTGHAKRLRARATRIERKAKP